MEFEFLSTESITRRLVNRRVKLAKKNHDKAILESYRKSSNAVCRTSDDLLIYEVMPPRNHWRTLTRKEREKVLDSISTNRKRILKTIEWDQKKNADINYLSKLELLITDIQNKGWDLNYRIKPPNIIPKKKDPTFEKKDLRPICVFNIIDNIILQEVNTLLTKLFDPLFLDCSFAFRCKPSNGRIPSHHDTIAKIKEYREQHKDETIYVAECDLQKFFDTINHQIIKKEFFDALSETCLCLSDNQIQIIVHVFLEYLNSFDFQKSILPYNEDLLYLERNKCSGGSFAWIDSSKLFEQYKNPSSERLGIPQGGALSGIIANLVLNVVDKSVFDADKDFLYLRYCDDMIMMHTDKCKLENKLAIYQKAVKGQKLFIHEPIEIGAYSKEFYDSKSKKPYPWGSIQNGCVPWISFVGYQIGFNGEVRVRKNSINKEINKQYMVARSALRHIQSSRYPVKSKRRICISLYNRFIGMSVGRVKLYNYKSNIDRSMCWVNGFKELNNNRFSRAQMRLLDRARRRRYRYFCKGLNQLIGKDVQLKNGHAGSSRQIVFWGKPFSYYEWLEKK